MKQVNASHVLVKTEMECLNILKEIVSKKMTFEDAAKKHSLCPSKKNGGNLGNFGRGMMVLEFDEVCFDSKNQVGDIKGPIKTQFGFHLIKINAIS